MRNLDIVDTRDKLAIYAQSGLLSLGGGAALPSLTAASTDEHVEGGGEAS